MRRDTPTLLLTAWLAAFWFLSPTSWHRCLLGLLVISSLLPQRTDLPGLVKRERWLWLAGSLLAWQSLSRFWSSGSGFPCAWPVDSLLVAGLLCSLFFAAGGAGLSRTAVPAVSLVSAAVSLASLLVFYPLQGHDFAADRLRNVFFYSHGLNAVPTGFLFAFGALTGLWMVMQSSAGPRKLWTSASGLSLLGLLATQSRGPMLMFAVGLFLLLAAERKKAVPPLIISVATPVIYFSLLLMARTWADATTDLFQRGTTGRLEIYQTYLGRMTPVSCLIGTGMADAPILPKDVLGWRVVHPHSIYLTQLYQTGIPGLAMLLALIAWALRSALKLAKQGDPLWLSLLGGASTALIFDGGQTFTVYSFTRIEILLIAIPAAIAVAKAAGPARSAAALLK
ncbi:MAG: O-antigen ligase family protein [Verrucomicrobiota bacterium JB025]|nr:O-antigen ligase family protein [Verrucomicrobiota bacterium JB025]